MKINKTPDPLQLRLAVQVGRPLWGIADTEDIAEVVILCLNERVVIKVQIQTEWMFHFSQWCERKNRLSGWSSTHTAHIWLSYRKEMKKKHQSHKILRKWCYIKAGVHFDACLSILIWKVPNSQFIVSFTYKSKPTFCGNYCVFKV